MFASLQVPGKATREFYGYGPKEILLFKFAAVVAVLPLAVMILGSLFAVAGQEWGEEAVSLLVNNFGGMMFFIFVAPALIRSLAAHPFGPNRHVPIGVAKYKWFATIIWALALAGMTASLVFIVLNVLERQADRTSIQWFAQALYSLSLATPYVLLRSIQESANQRQIDELVRGGGAA